MPKDTAPTSGASMPVMTDIKRTRYDLSNFSMKVGAIGSLQTLMALPIVAGDSIALDASSVVRQSPLRRNLYLDVVCDKFAFFVPHRHIYGDDWINFIKQGYDEAVTLGVSTMQTDAELQSAGLNTGANFTQPKWITNGITQIYNNFFRDPSDIAGILADNYLTTLAANHPTLDYGFPCAHMKRIWNSAILPTIGTGDYRLPLTGGEVDLYNLDALKGRLKTEQKRDFFAIRYNDILNDTWQSTVNTDADKRPTLIMRSRQWLSGRDVDGTDDATLGRYTGKSVGVMNIKFPKRFFSEHGTLYVMMLLRYPPLHEFETHYLITKPEPTYAQIAGDPDVIRRTGPIALDIADAFINLAPGVALGSSPHSQWYREQPHTVHRKYTDAAGHPFLVNNPSTRNEAIYIPPERYDGIYESLALKHWQSQTHIAIQADRFIPDPQHSIFAGTN